MANDEKNLGLTRSIWCAHYSGNLNFLGLRDFFAENEDKSGAKLVLFAKKLGVIYSRGYVTGKNLVPNA